MINFKASYIHSTNILKKEPNQGFIPHQVAFVEVEPTNFEDILAINNANIKWDGGETLASHIIYNMNSIYKKLPQIKEKKFYALTTQQDSFEKLEPESILGLAEVSKLNNETQEIDYLQLNPKYLGKVRELIKMGDAIMKSIKALFPNKMLEVNSSATAINFYRRNGFLPLNSFGRMRFIP